VLTLDIQLGSQMIAVLWLGLGAVILNRGIRKKSTSDQILAWFVFVSLIAVTYITAESSAVFSHIGALLAIIGILVFISLAASMREDETVGSIYPALAGSLIIGGLVLGFIV